MPTFRIQLDTAFKAVATDAELASTFTTITAGGGTDVSVFREAGGQRPRAEFSLEAGDRNQAALSVGSLLVAVMEATPSVAGGWVLASLQLA
jgi:hypothetical protein